MSNVVDMPARGIEAENRAFEQYSAALHRAQTTGKLRDMAEAVRAYEAFLALLIPNQSERSEVWP